jgi:hypothetical protein
MVQVPVLVKQVDEGRWVNADEHRGSKGRYEEGGREEGVEKSIE